MKSNNPLKKENKKFDPATHWLYLLSFLCTIGILVITYAIYSFFYIRHEIVLIGDEARQNVQNSTSTDYIEKTKQNNKLMRDINDLNKNLKTFDAKEVVYEKILSTPVATSSNQ